MDNKKPKAKNYHKEKPVYTPKKKAAKPKPKPDSFVEQMSKALGFTKSKADKGTDMEANRTKGRQFKSQDERVDDYKPPGKHRDVSPRLGLKKRKK